MKKIIVKVLVVVILGLLAAGIGMCPTKQQLPEKKVFYFVSPEDQDKVPNGYVPYIENDNP